MEQREIQLAADNLQQVARGKLITLSGKLKGEIAEIVESIEPLTTFAT